MKCQRNFQIHSHSFNPFKLLRNLAIYYDIINDDKHDHSKKEYSRILERS